MPFQDYSISGDENVWEMVAKHGNILSNISNVFNISEKIEKVKDELSKLKLLLQLLTTNKVVSCEDAKKLIDDCKSPQVVSRRDDFIAAIQSSKIAPCELVHCVNENIQQCANKALTTGLVSSLYGLAREAYYLHNIWSEIQKAKELAIHGFDEKKQSIQSKMAEIPAKISEFADGITPSCYENLDSNQRLRFHVRKNRQKSRLQKLIDVIKEEIGNLKVTVNGKIEKLSAHCDGASKSAMQHNLQRVSRGVDLALYGSEASTGYVASTYLAMFLHAAAAVAHLLFKRNAEETIKILRGKLVEVNQLSAALQELQEELDNVFEEFEERINVAA